MIAHAYNPERFFDKAEEQDEDHVFFHLLEVAVVSEY